MVFARIKAWFARRYDAWVEYHELSSITPPNQEIRQLDTAVGTIEVRSDPSVPPGSFRVESPKAEPFDNARAVKEWEARNWAPKAEEP